MPTMPTDLPDNDRALVEAARAGDAWSPMGENKDVRATTIRALYLGLWDGVVVDPKGVRVTGAHIVGGLDLSFGTGRGALSLQHCHFDERVVIREGRLPALWLVGSHLAKGLSGDGARIDGDLICRDGFHSIGKVRLLGAQIGGDADFDGAHLDGNGGAALNVDRMVVTGGLFCSDGFRSSGEVRLLGAQIGGNADFGGATLDGNGGAALSADGMVVIGSLFCRKGDDKGFHIKGDTTLVGARIGGLMDWRPEQWTGELDLSHAVVGQWCDAWGASATAGAGQSSITLDHFSYGAFLSWEGMKADSSTRIAWIQASQGDNFTPGPYQTLARVLRAAGDDRGAAAVGLAKEKARTRHSIATCRADASHAQTPKWKRPLLWGRAVWTWSLTSLFNLFVGYGYYPRRGVGWLAGMLAAGWLVFWLGGPTPDGGPGHIKPADPVFIAQNHITKPGEYETSAQEEKVLERGHRFGYTLPVEYTPFSAFWYSFDTLIPLIDLGQEKAWSPSPLTPNFLNDIGGWALLFYLYIHIIMGWVLTTPTVVAMTGLIKRDKDVE